MIPSQVCTHDLWAKPHLDPPSIDFSAHPLHLKHKSPFFWSISVTSSKFKIIDILRISWAFQIWSQIPSFPKSEEKKGGFLPFRG